MSILSPVRPGDHAPWFELPALSGSPNYKFHSVAGRYVMLLFLGSAARPKSQEALQLVARNRELFDDSNACFFGVTADRSDPAEDRIAQQLPGIRFFLDFDAEVSRLYGAAVEDNYSPRWLLLDPALRVLQLLPIGRGEEAMQLLRDRLAQPASEDGMAPVLRVSDIFEPELCRWLIGLYEEHGGKQSGFMRDVDGKTTTIVDPNFKQRRDYEIDDQKLRESLIARLQRRLVPAIEKAFQFQATRIERHIVACYEAGAGFFRAHRDNTTKGTAHRRFAVTINLNADDYEGGDLRFPEFGTRAYRAPTGGAIVFSCSLLHEALPVTSGRRYAYLPFLYDDEAARIREANSKHLAVGAGQYKA